VMRTRKKKKYMNGGDRNIKSGWKETNEGIGKTKFPPRRPSCLCNQDQSTKYVRAL
jgi:hypothetical protein